MFCQAILFDYFFIIQGLDPIARKREGRERGREGKERGGHASLNQFKMKVLGIRCLLI